MSIRWIKDGEPHSAEVYNRPLRDYIQEAETTFAKQSLNIEVSNGLSGGGKLVGDVINISANDATTQQKGVVRFATLEEANEGTPGVVVSPDVVKNMGMGIGYNQKWVNVKSQRKIGETYINDTNAPIMVNFSSGQVGRISRSWVLYVDDVMVARGDTSMSDDSLITAIVPVGSTYRITLPEGGILDWYWAELR